MEGLLILIVCVLALAVVDAASIWFGVDSRDGSHDPRNQSHPVSLK